MPDCIPAGGVGVKGVKVTYSMVKGVVCCALQAMDRCHRIGQVKPVLVLRLATAHSVEGKLLRRARSKLALERLVIKKGAFLPGETVPPRPHQRICSPCNHL